MQKWEYKVLDHAPKEDELNKLGGEGWELISVAGTDTQYYRIHAFFKRPVSD